VQRSVSPGCRSSSSSPLANRLQKRQELSCRQTVLLPMASHNMAVTRVKDVSNTKHLRVVKRISKPFTTSFKRQIFRLISLDQSAAIGKYLGGFIRGPKIVSAQPWNVMWPTFPQSRSVQPSVCPNPPRKSGSPKSLDLLARTSVRSNQRLDARNNDA
jgi:hypothetical protein